MRNARRRRRKRRISLLVGMILFFTAVYGIFLLVTLFSSSVTSCQTNAKKAKASKLLKETDTYPQELLDMLSRNPDMLDFVEGYPEKKGQVFADSIGDVKKGEYPLLLQWDERWGIWRLRNKLCGSKRMRSYCHFHGSCRTDR